MNTLDQVEAEYLRDDIPEFGPGDNVKVNVRVVEGGRERVQVFEGAVIARDGGGLRETFTVRKVSFGVGQLASRRSGTPNAPAADCSDGVKVLSGP